MNLKMSGGGAYISAGSVRIDSKEFLYNGKTQYFLQILDGTLDTLHMAYDLKHECESS